MAKDSTEECKNLVILRRADHFVLLLDGDKLAQVKSRSLAASEGASLLRSCLDAEMLGRDSLVDVLFTKWDLIQSRGSQSGAEDYVAYIKETMKQRFESQVGHLRFFPVAARREEDSDLPFAYGLDVVFPSWVEEARAHSVSRSQAIREPQWAGESDFSDL